MSPGLRSRPSLSERNHDCRRGPPRSVAGITVPAFVERRAARTASYVVDRGVAGITVPAFVERSTSYVRLIMFDRAEVSPGLRSRPSLSVSSPARKNANTLHGRVSPGLRSRPSLSDVHREPDADRIRSRSVAGITVPAFVERVTKSAMRMSGRSGVAGITVPAFVERGARALTKSLLTRCVAGITVPAFVERTMRTMRAVAGYVVSPGLRSRPSLSDVPHRQAWIPLLRVSPGLRSRPSLSGNT